MTQEDNNDRTTNDESELQDVVDQGSKGLKQTKSVVSDTTDVTDVIRVLEGTIKQSGYMSDRQLMKCILVLAKEIQK